MATKKSTKKKGGQRKSSKRSNKALKIIISLVVVIGLIITAGCSGLIETIFGAQEQPPSPPVSPTTSPKPTISGSADELQVHFMEMDTDKTGDCVLIKVGDTEVLIDAGPLQSSSNPINDYVKQYCSDGKLEYVIATHAHKDHIAGFVGTADAPSLFERYECETIIDFPKTNSTSALYSNYIKKRDAEVALGAKHYTALECWNNENGAKRDYELGNGVTMSILYNYYYENKTSDENDYSVCVLITQGEKTFLFTGDLEEKGEEYLVKKNNLPEIDVFKANHHGSYTASSEALLSVIKPKYVVVTCVAGSDEYTDIVDNQFPSQAFISRISKYTDKVYCPTVTGANKSGYQSLNGDIVITSDGKTIKVNCSNNTTILKNTDWFKSERKWS